MQLLWPWFLLALPLPIFAYLKLKACDSENASLRVPFFKRAQAAQADTQLAPNNRSFFSTLCLSLAWLCFVLALAQPAKLGEALQLPSSGRDMMLAVDISMSMRKADMRIQNRNVQRISVVKFILEDFLTKRDGDRIGLILFGSGAYLQAPLTFDLKTVNQLLQEASLGIAGPETAIGDAIGLAVKQLKERPESQRVLILLTDGSNTAGSIDPEQAARLAAQAKVKVHTIGVVPRSSPYALRENRIDEQTLQNIAEQTGGGYFRATNPKELLEVYDELNNIEKIELDDNQYRPLNNYFYWPLSLSLLLLMLPSLSAWFGGAINKAGTNIKKRSGNA
ncbi:vWA domain-containing protein [Agaribacterium haliotis]|uniref:vWA domain-containing protein n=1 Tax=Agaribacterium haliotis TaxID=2013869 RepID=UPI000BB53559|nr:VWA domain-containing protein [Agaribacterium haliotis]